MMPEEILKQTEGQIVSINHDKRGLAIKDKAGDTHPFYWQEQIKMTNNKGEPLKQWWFIKVVAEKQKDDTWWITSQGYFQRPEDWPTTGGRKPVYQPRNERLIVTQMLIKTYADLCKFDFDPSDFNFKIARKLILDAVEEDIDRVMKIGGEGK
jgi:hypothetical protein